MRILVRKSERFGPWGASRFVSQECLRATLDIARWLGHTYSVLELPDLIFDLLLREAVNTKAFPECAA